MNATTMTVKNVTVMSDRMPSFATQAEAQLRAQHKRHRKALLRLSAGVRDAFVRHMRAIMRGRYVMTLDMAVGMDASGKWPDSGPG